VGPSIPDLLQKFLDLFRREFSYKWLSSLAFLRRKIGNALIFDEISLYFSLIPGKSGSRRPVRCRTAWSKAHPRTSGARPPAFTSQNDDLCGGAASRLLYQAEIVDAVHRGIVGDGRLGDGSIGM
jgi:hypothetical protein